MSGFNHKKIIIGIIASLAISSSIGGLRHQRVFEPIELLAYDFLIRLNAKSGFDDRITIVGVDDKTLQQLESDKISDRVMQQALAKIARYEPRVIGVDIIRDIPIGAGREELIGYVNHIYQPLEGVIKPIIFPCALPSENKPSGIAPPAVIDTDSAVGFVDLDTDSSDIFGRELVRRASISSIPVENESGNSSQKSDDFNSDEALCKVPFSFGFLTALSYIQALHTGDGISNLGAIINYDRITEGEVAVKSFTFNSLNAKTGSYQNLNTEIFQYLIDYGYEKPGKEVSLQDVLDDRVSGEAFKNKVVLIGYVTKEDIHQTPLGLRPGVMVHGWIISQILDNALEQKSAIWSWSEPVEWLWIIGWGVAGAIVALRIRPLGIYLASQIIAVALLFASSWFIFTKQGWIPLIPPIFSLTLSGVAVKVISPKFKLDESGVSSKRVPIATVVEQLIENTNSEEREPLITVVERLIENTNSEEREPLITVVEQLKNDTSASHPADTPLITVVEQLKNSTDIAQQEPLITVVERLLENASSEERQPLATMVEQLKNSQSTRPTFIRDREPFMGKVIGDGDRYILKKLLGQGGMSKVYLAWDRKLSDKRVAVKIMTNFFSADNQNITKRFMGEVKSLSILNHPNIIQIYDYGYTPQAEPFAGYPFYVMEYFEGKTLQQLLKEHHQLASESALKIALRVCQGLKAAHEKGIIHRDLKPDNIFLIPGSALGEVVKLIDFGIAKKIDEENQQLTQLTVEGTFIGTYRYASPEQCLGLNVDSRTDIYSLGMLLYEMLSGNNPYNLQDDSNTTNADWSVAHRKEVPLPLTEQQNCADISFELAHIVMKCLAKSPQDRFQNIEELERALRSCL